MPINKRRPPRLQMTWMDAVIIYFRKITGLIYHSLLLAAEHAERSLGQS